MDKKWKNILWVTSLCITICGCRGIAKSQGSIDSSAQIDEDSVVLAPVAEEAYRIELPQRMMPGPIDPIPEEGNKILLYVANMGHFSSIDQFKESPFYEQFCSLYPELNDIGELTLDLAEGDLWYLKPTEPNLSMAINEYGFEFFNGKKNEDDAKVLFRTEEAKPMLVRLSANAPGTTKINIVDNEGNVVTWIPSQHPSDNTLQTEVGILVFTYNPLEVYAILGADYTAYGKDSQEEIFRFYADHLVRIGEKLYSYHAFHQEDGEIGLYIYGQGKESYGVLGGPPSDEGDFTLTIKAGNDFKLGAGEPVQMRQCQNP